MQARDFLANHRLETRAQAREAFDGLLKRAQRSLCIYDRDGAFWGLDRMDFAESLAALLGRRGATGLTLLVQSSTFVERECARLLALQRRFGHALRILRPTGDAAKYPRGIVLIDDIVALRRPDFDSLRAFVDFDDTAVAAMVKLFDELKTGAEPAASGSVTGL